MMDGTTCLGFQMSYSAGACEYNTSVSLMRRCFLRENQQFEMQRSDADVSLEEIDVFNHLYVYNMCPTSSWSFLTQSGSHYVFMFYQY